MAWETLPHGKRPLGRPCMRWKDNVKTDLKSMNIKYGQAKDDIRPKKMEEGS